MLNLNYKLNKLQINKHFFIELNMKKTFITCLFLFCFNLLSLAQNKFQAIDDLIATESMIDAKTALEKLETTLNKENNTSNYWLRVSKANVNIYKYDEAEKAINKAIELDKKNPIIHYEKGRLLNKIDKNEQAKKSFSQAILLNPESNYYFWRGISNQNLGLINEAQKDYKMAIELSENTPEVHFNYAIVLHQNGDFQESLKHNNKAIDLNPDYARAYSFRAMTHLMLFDLDAACADSDKAFSLGINKVVNIPVEICKGSKKEKFEFIGGFCLANKQYKKGVEVFTKLIEYNENLTAKYHNRGYSYFQIKDYNNAEKDYLKALELPKAEVDMLYDNLSLLYFDQENFTKSLEYASKRIELNPKNQVPYLDRGLNYRKLKKYVEAENDYNKSLEISPNFFRAFGYRASLNLELGNFLKAYEDATKAVEINPNYDFGYLILGQAKMALDMPDYCNDIYKAKRLGNPEADEAILKFCK